MPTSNPPPQSPSSRPALRPLLPIPSHRKPWYRVLYIQVLIAVLLGVLVGQLFPDFGKTLKPLGDGFIKLVKMIIGPIIFCTVVHGIASMGDLKKLGRLGVKTLLYFEIVSTVALIVGLTVVNLWKPGAGLHINPSHTRSQNLRRATPPRATP